MGGGREGEREGGRRERRKGGSEEEEGKKRKELVVVGFNSQTFLNSTKRLNAVVKGCTLFTEHSLIGTQRAHLTLYQA